MYDVVENPDPEGTAPGEPPSKPVRRVYEQRYSHLIQAVFILVFVTPPFQHVLGLTPTSVLAGLFMFMGYQSLTVNPVLDRIWNLLTPISELPTLPQGATWLGVHTYTITQLIMTGIVFGVTLTIAAPGFPIIIIILVPVRLLLMNKIWSRQTLRYVDSWATRDGKPEDDDEDRRRAGLMDTGASLRNIAVDPEKGGGHTA